MPEPKSFTLQDIAGWQLNAAQSEVELPLIQRGFVWKPKQVEDLWDSILRGYPIGSFLLSRTKNGKFYLMDGQQRATSIFIGYFNPFNSSGATKTWAIKGELPVAWIDLNPEHKPDINKFLIRLTTRSHPWGYQVVFNNQKLSMSDRHTAWELFKKHPDNTAKGYTSFKNSTVFPFDCWFPLPISFFIEATTVDEIIEKAEKWLPNYFYTKGKKFTNKSEFIDLLKEKLSDNISEILKSIERIRETKIIANIIDEEVLKEETELDNPTLFVRMNSSGTTLTGDDLIYSIYKSTFPDVKALIEKIGMDFVMPTQVLSLVSRIAASDLNGEYAKKMNVKDFQGKIKKNDEFKNKLKELIKRNEAEPSTAETLFKQATEILSCKNNCLLKGEIPPIIIKTLIRKNQDLFLFLVYWLYINSKRVELTDNTKLRILAKLFSFAWFGFIDIRQLWKNVKNQSFWNEPLNELIWCNEDEKHGIHFLIEPQLLQNYYLQPQVEKGFIDNTQDKWSLQRGADKELIGYFNSVKFPCDTYDTTNKYFWKFIQKIQHNKQLILFAQRDYINSTFGDFNQMDEIENTNVPWDWDHIYPSEWVYNQKNCHPGIRDWNNTNGNLRAISLEHNRSRSNRQSPKDISDSKEREYSFIQDGDWESWGKITGRIWDNNIQHHFKAVTTRMINIYEKFWNDFKISELIER
jgi:hypothetical protein